MSNKKTFRQNSAIAPNLLYSPESDSQKISPMFFDKISNMMRGYGDMANPLKESVLHVEKIVTQQLKGILQDAIDHCVERKGYPAPTQKDFEYLMRKNPEKILRLRKDLFMLKRFRELIQNINDTTEGQVADSDEEYTLEVPERYDEEKIRRLFRADRISQILSGTQYKEFNDARKNSFLLKSSRDLRLKMKTWLNVPNEIRLSHHTLTILAILAHETIAKIVDMCILTRLNSENRQVDPYSRITSSGTSHSMLHLCPEVTQGRGCDGVKNITVPEINEAIRRYNTQSMKQLGHFRNNCYNQKIPYLAL